MQVVPSSLVLVSAWLLLAACAQSGATPTSAPLPTDTQAPTVALASATQHVPTLASTVAPGGTAATSTPTPPPSPTPAATPTPAPLPIVSPTSGRDDQSSRVEPLDPPDDLSLPFRIEDVGGGNEFISPFGIVRHSRDAGHGHGGIDIPLDENAPVYAVADGTILSAQESSDGAGGFDVKLLISGSGGEGWGFHYEHVKLEPEIAVGSAVTEGQLIARNGLTTDRRNNHLQLSYMFNDYAFFRDQRCWVDHLDPSSRSSLLDYFDSTKTTERFIAQWDTASEEGMMPYKELLNKERFPGGPRLCYTLGLDVRAPDAEQSSTATESSQTDDQSDGIEDDQGPAAQDQAAETPVEECWQSAQVGQIRTREDYYYEELRGSSLRVLL